MLEAFLQRRQRHRFHGWNANWRDRLPRRPRIPPRQNYFLFPVCPELIKRSMFRTCRRLRHRLPNLS
jgi:hypothetical protein